MKAYFPAMLVASCLCAPAVAAPVVPLSEQPLYWAVSYVWADYTQENFAGDEAQVGAVAATLGYEFSPMISAEARYIEGVRDSDAGGLNIEIDQLYGVYGKFSLLTDINLTPYAIVGYTQGKVTELGGGTSADDNGLTYGIGIDFCRDEPACLTAEYTSYLDEDAFDVSAMSVGLKFKF